MGSDTHAGEPTSRTDARGDRGRRRCPGDGSAGCADGVTSPAGPAVVARGGIDGSTLRPGAVAQRRPGAGVGQPERGCPAARPGATGRGSGSRHSAIVRATKDVGQIRAIYPNGHRAVVSSDKDNTIKLRGASSIQPHRCGRSSPGPTQGMRTGRPAASWTGVRPPVARRSGGGPPSPRPAGADADRPGHDRPDRVSWSGCPRPAGFPGAERATTQDLLPRKDRGRLAHRR